MEVTLQQAYFFRRVFVVMGLWLLVSQPGVSGQCSELQKILDNVEIHADWWSVLPYSVRAREKNGNYTYSGKLHYFVLNVVKWYPYL